MSGKESIECPLCEGTGRVLGMKCRGCDGKGRIYPDPGPDKKGK